MLAGMLAFLVAYGVVFKIVHTISDGQEDAARLVADHNLQASWLAEAGAKPLHFFNAVPPPCPVCLLLAKVTVPAAFGASSVTSILVTASNTILDAPEYQTPQLRSSHHLSRGPPQSPQFS